MNNDRKQLLSAYISLVGKVNRLLHSRLWWATDFSSKNRFNTRLPQLMQEFITVIEKSLKDGKPPVFDDVSWQIRGSLKKYFKKTAIPTAAAFQSFRAFGDIVLEFIKRLTGGCYHFFRLLYRYGYARFLLSAKIQRNYSHQQPVYVIKTFVYDHSFSQDGAYRDVFFGCLPEFLEKRGERVVFFADILGGFQFCLKKIGDCPNALIIPIDFFSSFFSILTSCLTSCFYWPQVKEGLSFLDYEVSDLINAELSSRSSRIQPYQILQYAQMKALLKKFTVKTFLMTYENNPWEKMCLLALRESSPQTKVLGYQHTVTPEASVNMFNSGEEESVILKPDRVLTVGQVSKKIIERYTLISSLPVVAACALRYEKLLRLPVLPRTKHLRILIALEGILDVYQMVNYVLAQLEDCTKYQIIIRAHPVLPLKAFLQKLNKRLPDWPFVEISKEPLLLKDIERCDLTIYWGSTVALETLWLGKPVVHFDKGELFSYDPLFDCSYFKWTVNPNQKLTEVLDEIYTLSDEDFLSRGQKAREYLQEYFYSPSPSYLAKFCE